MSERLVKKLRGAWLRLSMSWRIPKLKLEGCAKSLCKTVGMNGINGNRVCNFEYWIDEGWLLLDYYDI